MNIERNGFSVAVYNAQPPSPRHFAVRHAGKNNPLLFSAELVASLESPRKVMLMVKPATRWMR